MEQHKSQAAEPISSSDDASPLSSFNKNWFSLDILFGGIFVLCGIMWSVLAIITRSEPLSVDPVMEFPDYITWRGALSISCAAVLLIILVGRWILYRTRSLNWIYLVATVSCGLIIAGSFSYFYAARGLTQRQYINFHDMYHYFLGAKYYAEVSYNQLYACHLEADEEREEPKYPDRTIVRDLQNYQLQRAERVRANADCSNFSKERWEEFKHDTTFFDVYSHRKVLSDHGYNGTPFHALFAGIISNIAPVSYSNLVLYACIDILVVCLLFAFLSWSVGWKMSTLFALFLFVNFGDYYFHVSFSRYWWLAALGVGLGFLYKKKYGPSAVFLVLSAMLNVFPLLFMAGIGLKILVSVTVKRHLNKAYRSFVIWGTVATVMFGGISLLHRNPIERYETFFQNMNMHSNLFTTSRIGFKYNFLYRGESHKPLPGINYNTKLNELKPYLIPYHILVGLVLLLGAVLVLRLDDFRATILAGFLLFFMLFSTVAYYYACASTLVFLWGVDLRRTRNLFFVTLLFVLMASVYFFWWETQFRMFINNTILTAVFTIFSASSMAVLAVETNIFKKSGWYRLIS